MKKLLLTGALLCATTAARADELPLTDLQDDGVAKTELGAFELRAWSNRDDFPAVKEIAAAKAGDKGRFSTPGAAEITVKDASLEFLSHGRAEFTPAFDWAPLLVFTPKTAGDYALRGSLKLGTNANGAGDFTATSWAVVRFKDGATKFAVVALGKAQGDETVDLGAQVKLSSIALGKGESLGVAVWRPAWHFSGYGSLTGLQVTRATPEAARAVAQALEAETIAAREAARAAIEAGRQSDAFPGAALLASSVAQSKSGTFSLMGYTGRDDLLKLGNGIEVRGGKGGEKSQEWRTPGEAQLTVEPNSVAFHTNGRAAWDNKFNWLPVLQWTPREAGTYGMTGTLDLYTGQKSAEADKPDAVAWAVLKLSEDGTAQVVAQKRYADKTKVELSEQAELKAIKLAKGESLAVTVFRPAWHFNAGGTLKNLEISKAAG